MMGPGDLEMSELALVSRVALASIGPHGSLWGIRANEQSGVGTITSVSKRLFENLRLRTWLARALVKLTVQPQHEVFGDGGLLTAVIATKLVETVVANSSSSFDRFHMTQGLELILDFLREKMKTDLVLEAGNGNGLIRPILELHWNDMDSIVALVRGVIEPKLKAITASSSRGDMNHLCRTLAEAYVLALPDNAYQKPRIGLLTIAGPSISRSFSTSNLIIDIPISHQLERMMPLTLPSIVVFNTSLDVDLARNEQQLGNSLDSDGYGVKIEVSRGFLGECNAEAVMNFELNLLVDLVKRLAKEKVSIVACQKTIHPFVKQELVHRRIIPIERISLRHIDAVASCCGVQPISSIGEHSLSKLGSHVGKLQRISLVRLERKKLVELEPTRDRNMQTVVLTAPSEISIEDLATSCRSVFAVLNSAIASPYVIPGGGCLELVLSTLIQSQVSSVPEASREERLTSKVLESFVQVLRSIASNLQGEKTLEKNENGVEKSEAIFLSLQHFFAVSRKEEKLLDLVISKLAAIEYAVDAACNLSRIDRTLTT